MLQKLRVLIMSLAALALAAPGVVFDGDLHAGKKKHKKKYKKKNKHKNKHKNKKARKKYGDDDDDGGRKRHKKRRHKRLNWTGDEDGWELILDEKSGT